MDVLTIAGRKGGSGKSCSAGHLAGAWAEQGKQVLLVDLDSQASLSRWLCPGGPSDGERLGVALRKGGNLVNLVKPSNLGNVRLLSSGPGLAEAEVLVEADKLGLQKVQRALESLHQLDVDLVIHDLPPSLSVLCMAALAASRWALIPCPCEPAAAAALPATLQVVGQVRDLVAPELAVLGVVATRHDRRPLYSADTLATLHKALGKGLARTVIPASAALAMAMGAGQVAPRWSPGGRAYHELAMELSQRMKRGRSGQSMQSSQSRQRGRYGQAGR